jgi:D-alanyl-D-alanine dipeptidase
MRKILVGVLTALVVACVPPRTRVPASVAAPPINTAETAIAPNAVADTLLTDVRSLDSTIVVDLRYATSNNFT